MKILLTGGTGDLGRTLSRSLAEHGDDPVSLDLHEPKEKHGIFIKGSILDRKLLKQVMAGINCVVHIAAWHGIHLVRNEKDIYDFWDLNVTGTFNIFQAAAEAGVDKVIHISSESVADRYGIYGHTKVLAEEIAKTYSQRHHLNVIILRPRAFIPYWNRNVYPTYLDWAKWFWKGAVHIDDVNRATMQAIELLKRKKITEPPVLNVDGAYEFTDRDLRLWDQAGPGTTFRKYYPEYFDMVIHFGLDPTIRPEKLDISETKRWLGYEPQYSLKSLLLELQKFGSKGPPVPDY